MGMRRMGTRHAPEVPNDHTNLTSTASDEDMRALVPHMRTQHAPSTGTTGWQRMDQAQTPDRLSRKSWGGVSTLCATSRSCSTGLTPELAAALMRSK